MAGLAPSSTCPDVHLICATDHRDGDYLAAATLFRGRMSTEEVNEHVLGERGEQVDDRQLFNVTVQFFALLKDFFCNIAVSKETE